MTTGPDSPVDATNQALDQWMADAQSMAARYQELAANMEQVVVTETTPDGMITVTVDSRGLLTDLRIAERATASMPAAKIASNVLGAMRTAQSRISGRAAEVMKATLGDSDPGMAEAVLNNYQESFPPPFEPQQARPDAVEEVRIGHEETPAAAPAPAPPRTPARTPVRRARASADDWDGGGSFLEEVDR